jgi:hypothetical protein
MILKVFFKRGNVHNQFLPAGSLNFRKKQIAVFFIE